MTDVSLISISTLPFLRRYIDSMLVTGSEGRTMLFV